MPFLDACTPILQPPHVTGMAFVTPKTQQQKRRGHPHVHRVSAQRGIADHSTKTPFAHGTPYPLYRLGILRCRRKPFRVAKLHSRLKCTGPRFEVNEQTLRMLGAEVWWELDESRPPFVPECIEACNEIIGRASAIVESAVMRDDRRKLRAKPEIIRHTGRPFRHPLWRMYPVMGGIQFNRAKSLAIVNGPSALRRLFRINAAPPWTNGPHRSSGAHLQWRWRSLDQTLSEAERRIAMIWRQSEIDTRQQGVLVLFRNLAILHVGKETGRAGKPCQFD